MELINLEYALQQIEIGEFEHRSVFESDSTHIKDFLNALPTVDAVPVDEIKLHHILIDNEGVPEVKLQFGDRFVVLRTDPVDVREVVHGRWVWDVETHGDTLYGVDEDFGYRCSECQVWADEYGVDGDVYEEPPTHILHYCPNCGARMDAKEDFNEVQRLHP